MSRDEDDRQLAGCLQGFTIMLMGLFFLTMVMLAILGLFGVLPDA